MKKMFSGLMLSMVLMTGCVSTNVKETVARNAERSDKMVKKMEAGETTRDQEQEYIRATRAGFKTLDYYVNDEPLPLDLQFLLEEK